MRQAFRHRLAFFRLPYEVPDDAQDQPLLQAGSKGRRPVAIGTLHRTTAPSRIRLLKVMFFSENLEEAADFFSLCHGARDRGEEVPVGHAELAVNTLAIVRYIPVVRRAFFADMFTPTILLHKLL